MLHSLIKGAAVLALGSLACAGHALAVSPLPLNGAAPCVIPIQDEENQEVWQDLRPDITPPPAVEGKEGEQGSATERPKEEEKGSSGDVEQKELKEDGLEGN